MMEESPDDIAAKVRSTGEIMSIPMQKLKRKCKKKEAGNDGTNSQQFRKPRPQSSRQDNEDGIEERVLPGVGSAGKISNFKANLESTPEHERARCGRPKSGSVSASTGETTAMDCEPREHEESLGEEMLLEEESQAQDNDGDDEEEPDPTTDTAMGTAYSNIHGAQEEGDIELEGTGAAEKVDSIISLLETPRPLKGHVANLGNSVDTQMTHVETQPASGDSGVALHTPLIEAESSAGTLPPPARKALVSSSYFPPLIFW